MKRWAIRTVAVLALVGAVLAGISTSQHLRLIKEGIGASHSFCNINSYINCDLVNLSSYSSLAGVPVAWLGFLFYMLVLVCMLLAWNGSQQKRFHVTFALFASLLGFVVTLRMAYISWQVLQLLCLECLGMYVVNLLLLIFLFVALAQNPLRFGAFMRELLREPSRFLMQVVVSFIVLLLASFVMLQVKAEQAVGIDAAPVAEKLAVYRSSQPYDIQLNEKWPAWGNPQAKTVVIKFADFQCPICKVAAEDLPPYLHEFRNKVQLRYVHFPLSFHQNARVAAQASVCAQQRSNEDFWKYHDAIYQDQEKLNREFLLSLAEKQGFNRAEFEKCVDAPETIARVDEDLALAQRLHIGGTPTFLVNGKQVRYWKEGQLWQALLKEELKK